MQLSPEQHSTPTNTVLPAGIEDLKRTKLKAEGLKEQEYLIGSQKLLEIITQQRMS